MATIAEIIQERTDDIMKLWMEQARAAASARGLSKAALENVMPMFLASLADQVETGQPDAHGRRSRAVQNHLSTRLRQGFDLAEIVDEFGLVGRCIAHIWHSLPQHDWPSPADVERMHRQIQVAMTDVTNTFHRHMLEDEQSEKRYLRQLQTIAHEALHDVGRPLRERLGDLLDVVMEAMDAQCAAFLVSKLDGDKLELVACAGDEALEPYATSIDPKSFAGEIATHDEPTTMYDARSTHLEVPDALRRSGVRSLLGVRLPPRNNLLGVMYIGIAKAREFTPREVRRIESLGERLSLHLESARLFDELNEKITSLDVEKALRERFVSTLAHDLRGPLSSARLAAELIAIEPESLDARRELAVKIEHNIERVDRMIRDLLDANRIRAGEPLPLRLDACDLTSLAEQIVEEARAMHGDRFVMLADGPVRGVCSEEDIHRALWNLITNAVKYGAPKRPITISVTSDADFVRIAVHNEGRPIDPDDQEHIFDAYSRTPSAKASGRPGWGLGLTLVRGAAEAHGGHVTLTSDAASGTTFTIELPLDARTARNTTESAAQAVH